ncbi:MAG: hypothetical protein ACE5OY_07750 [Candidatus Bathyarchaeia archaeon]
MDKLWTVVETELASPLSISGIAERAGVAWDTARKYLEHLVKIGIVEEIGGTRERLFRTSGRYLTAKYLDEYSRYSVEDLEKALSYMYKEIAGIKKKYGVSTPGELRALLLKKGEEDFHEIWEDSVNWDSYAHKIPAVEAALTLKGIKEELHVSTTGIRKPKETSSRGT